MKTSIRKPLALVALPAALIALALGVSGTGAALAASEKPTGAQGNVGDTTTSASTTTLPWCGWYINGLSDSIVLDGESTYKGEAVDLTGSSGSTVQAFINGTSTYSSNAENCSWYADSNKQSAKLTVALAEGSSTSFSAMPSNNDATDSSMNFTLDSNNKLAITATPENDCTTNSFTVTEDASIWTGQTSSIPVQSSTTGTDITTANKCSWTMSYSTKIPANKTPKYGDLTYNYTGPTLVTTLEVADIQ